MEDEDMQVRQTQIKGLHHRIKEYRLSQIEQAEYDKYISNLVSNIELKFAKCPARNYVFPLQEPMEDALYEQANLLGEIVPFNLHTQNDPAPCEQDSITREAYRVLDIPYWFDDSPSIHKIPKRQTQTTHHTHSPQSSSLNDSTGKFILTSLNSEKKKMILTSSNSSNNFQQHQSVSSKHNNSRKFLDLKSFSKNDQECQKQNCKSKITNNHKQSQQSIRRVAQAGITPRTLQWEYLGQDAQPEAMKIPLANRNVANLKKSLRTLEDQRRSTSKQDNYWTRFKLCPVDKKQNNTSALTPNNQNSLSASQIKTMLSKKNNNNVPAKTNRHAIRLDIDSARHSSKRSSKGLTLSLKKNATNSPQSRLSLSQSFRLNSCQKNLKSHFNNTAEGQMQQQFSNVKSRIITPEKQELNQTTTAVSALKSQNTRTSTKITGSLMQRFHKNNVTRIGQPSGNNYMRFPINLQSPIKVKESQIRGTDLSNKKQS